MNLNFVEFFRWLESMGMVDAFLPFILVFAIMFAVLEKTQVLENKKINAVFAGVAGMLVVIPHIMGKYPAGKDIVVIINTALPNFIAVLIAVVLALVLLNITSDSKNSTFGNKWPVWVSLAVVVYIFGAAANWWTNIFGAYLNNQTMAVVLILIVFGLVFYYIVEANGDDDDDETRNPPKGNQ
ncbi:MAG: hypothetical protein ACLFPJ_02105 [Candidatus Woesearchaeota archaeon]